MAHGDRRPNLVFIMADDHTTHAVGAYGSRINRTPNIDRIAAEGARLDACFCTNSLCAPSRATILTGTYSRISGVRTLNASMDARQPTFPGMLRQAGYQTVILASGTSDTAESTAPMGSTPGRSSTTRAHTSTQSWSPAHGTASMKAMSPTSSRSVRSLGYGGSRLPHPSAR